MLKNIILVLYNKLLKFLYYRFFKPSFIWGYHPNCKTKLKDTRFVTHTYFSGLKNIKTGENLFIGNFNFLDSSIYNKN